MDLDFRALGQALTATGDDLIDAARGFLEESPDVLRNHFILMRQGGKGLQMVTDAGGMLLHGFDMGHGSSEVDHNRALGGFEV